MRNISIPKITLAAPILLALLSAQNPASAATRTWVGLGSDGLWTTAANWSGGFPASASSGPTILQTDSVPASSRTVTQQPNATVPSHRGACTTSSGSVAASTCARRDEGSSDWSSSPSDFIPSGVT